MAGAVVAFALVLLTGLGLKQGAESGVLTAGLIGVAVVMIGLQSARAANADHGAPLCMDGDAC